MKTHLMEGLHESYTGNAYSSAQVSMQETEEQLGHQITESSHWMRSEARSELMFQVHQS